MHRISTALGDRRDADPAARRAAVTAPRQDQAVQHSGPRSVAPDCGADGAAASAGPAVAALEVERRARGLTTVEVEGARPAEPGGQRGDGRRRAGRAPGRGAWVSAVPPVDRVRHGDPRISSSSGIPGGRSEADGPGGGRGQTDGLGLGGGFEDHSSAGSPHRGTRRPDPVGGSRRGRRLSRLEGCLSFRWRVTGRGRGTLHDRDRRRAAVFQRRCRVSGEGSRPRRSLGQRSWRGNALGVTRGGEHSS